MSLYEIEIKSLLGSKENADNLKAKVEARGGSLASENKQLNHYFLITDRARLKEAFEKFIPDSKKTFFRQILDEGKDCSVRTREVDGKVIFVIKASIGDDTSANGIAKMEFESEMNITLDELDQALLDAGLEYQAKWSREREEYKLGDVNVCI